MRRRKIVDKQSLIEIADTTRRLSHPLTYFLFAMRMTWLFWKFSFIKPGPRIVLLLVEQKRKAGALVHGPNNWTKKELANHLKDEFEDIYGWGDMLERKG